MANNDATYSSYPGLIAHRLAVVVLVFNSAKDASICIDQLLTFNNDYRIIVVDNCSTDDAYEVLSTRYGNMKFVDVIRSDSNEGYSVGNNFGIRYAMSRYDVDTVAIMNPDVVIPNVSVVENLVSLLWKHEDVLAVGGQPINGLEGDSPWPASWSLPSDREVVLNHLLLRRKPRRDDSVEVSPNIHRVDCIVGCFFVAKAVMFADIGLLDESVFLYNEENILGKKCKRAGLKLLVDKSQIYYHNHSTIASREKNLSAKLRERKSGYESRKYLAKTYYSPILVIPLALAEAFNCAVTVAGHVKRRIKWKAVER